MDLAGQAEQDVRLVSTQQVDHPGPATSKDAGLAYTAGPAFQFWGHIRATRVSAQNPRREPGALHPWRRGSGLDTAQRAAEGVAGLLTEHRAVVEREVPQLEEAPLHRDLRHRRAALRPLQIPSSSGETQ